MLTRKRKMLTVVQPDTKAARRGTNGELLSKVLTGIYKLSPCRTVAKLLANMLDVSTSTTPATPATPTLVSLEAVMSGVVLAPAFPLPTSVVTVDQFKKLVKTKIGAHFATYIRLFHGHGGHELQGKELRVTGDCMFTVLSESFGQQENVRPNSHFFSSDKCRELDVSGNMLVVANEDTVKAFKLPSLNEVWRKDMRHTNFMIRPQEFPCIHIVGHQVVCWAFGRVTVMNLENGSINCATTPTVPDTTAIQYTTISSYITRMAVAFTNGRIVVLAKDKKGTMHGVGSGQFATNVNMIKFASDGSIVISFLACADVVVLCPNPDGTYRKCLYSHTIRRCPYPFLWELFQQDMDIHAPMEVEHMVLAGNVVKFFRGGNFYVWDWRNNTASSMDTLQQYGDGQALDAQNSMINFEWFVNANGRLSNLQQTFPLDIETHYLQRISGCAFNHSHWFFLDTEVGVRFGELTFEV